MRLYNYIRNLYKEIKEKKNKDQMNVVIKINDLLIQYKIYLTII